MHVLQIPTEIIRNIFYHCEDTSKPTLKRPSSLIPGISHQPRYTLKPFARPLTRVCSEWFHAIRTDSSLWYLTLHLGSLIEELTVTSVNEAIDTLESTTLCDVTLTIAVVEEWGSQFQLTHVLLKLASLIRDHHDRFRHVRVDVGNKRAADILLELFCKSRLYYRRLETLEWDLIPESEEEFAGWGRRMTGQFTNIKNTPRLGHQSIHSLPVDWKTVVLPSTLRTLSISPYSAFDTEGLIQAPSWADLARVLRGASLLEEFSFVLGDGREMPDLPHSATWAGEPLVLARLKKLHLTCFVDQGLDILQLLSLPSVEHLDLPLVVRRDPEGFHAGLYENEDVIPRGNCEYPNLKKMRIKPMCRPVALWMLKSNFEHLEEMGIQGFYWNAFGVVNGTWTLPNQKIQLLNLKTLQLGCCNVVTAKFLSALSAPSLNALYVDATYIGGGFPLSPVQGVEEGTLASLKEMYVQGFRANAAIDLGDELRMGYHVEDFWTRGDMQQLEVLHLDVSGSSTGMGMVKFGVLEAPRTDAASPCFLPNLRTLSLGFKQDTSHLILQPFGFGQQFSTSFNLGLSLPMNTSTRLIEFLETRFRYTGQAIERLKVSEDIFRNGVFRGRVGQFARFVEAREPSEREGLFGPFGFGGFN